MSELNQFVLCELVKEWHLLTEHALPESLHPLPPGGREAGENRTAVVRVGNALDQTVPLQVVHEAGDVSWGHTQRLGQLTQAALAAVGSVESHDHLQAALAEALLIGPSIHQGFEPAAGGADRREGLNGLDLRALGAHHLAEPQIEEPPVGILGQLGPEMADGIVCARVCEVHCEALQYYGPQVYSQLRALNPAVPYPSAVLVAIGPLVLDGPSHPIGQLHIDDEPLVAISLTGGGPAAVFCAWAADLGEHARLITAVPDARIRARIPQEMENWGIDLYAFDELNADRLEEDWFRGARLLHLPVAAFLVEPMASASRRAIEIIRAQGGILSMDLRGAAAVPGSTPARLAFDVAKVRPELMFVNLSEAQALGAPLEGMAKVPVVRLGAQGCDVFGRRVPAPAVAAVDPAGADEAFAAAFCASYVDGAAPLEAAGRAVLVAANAATRRGPRP